MDQLCSYICLSRFLFTEWHFEPSWPMDKWNTASIKIFKSCFVDISSHWINWLFSQMRTNPVGWWTCNYVELRKLLDKRVPVWTQCSAEVNNIPSGEVFRCRGRRCDGTRGVETWTILENWVAGGSTGAQRSLFVQIPVFGESAQPSHSQSLGQLCVVGTFM